MRKRVAVSGVGVMAVIVFSAALSAQTGAPASSSVPDLSGDWAMTLTNIQHGEASARV